MSKKTPPSKVLLIYTEAQLHEAYEEFRTEIESLQNEGHNMGRMPDIEEFRIIFEEEQASL